VVLLVGGSSAHHRLDAESAGRIGREVAALARSAGGSVLATTSPRTGDEATDALAAGLGPTAFLHRWSRGGPENPYQALLGCADVLVVTGDSESMLAEAVATQKPVYVAEVPEKPLGPRRRFAEWVIRRAEARPRKQAKGTVRPQQGIEYLCARLVERAIVRPPRAVSELHRELARRGLARPLGERLDLTPPPPLREWEAVAARVRTILGVERPVADPAASEPRDPQARPRPPALGASLS
jgi:mitochondrial fission protein ELM1